MVDLSLNRSLLRLVFTQTTRFLAGTFFANFAKHRLQPTTFTYPPTTDIQQVQAFSVWSAEVVVGVVGGGRQSLILRDWPSVLRLEAPRNRIRTVEKKLGGVPRLHRLQLVDLRAEPWDREEIGVATAHEKEEVCSSNRATATGVVF